MIMIIIIVMSCLDATLNFLKVTEIWRQVFKEGKHCVSNVIKDWSFNRTSGNDEYKVQQIRNRCEIHVLHAK